MASSAGPISGRVGAPPCSSPLQLMLARCEADALWAQTTLQAAIHVDAFIEGTELEGGDTCCAVRYLLKSLQEFQKCNAVGSGKLEEILTILSTLQAIPNSKEKLLQMLPRGQKILLNGGWVPSCGHIGHAILYLVERNYNDTFNITLFNTGAGSEKHVGCCEDFIHPVQKYENVPSELIGDDFLIRISSLQIPDWEKSWSQWFGYYEDHPKAGKEADYLYGSLFSKWNHYKTAEAIPVKMKGQKSGTCYYRAPLALIKSYLSDKDYKLFKYVTKRNAFFQFYESIKRSGRIVPTEVLLIKEGGEKLLRTIGKLYDPDDRQPLLSSSEVQDVSTRVSEILKEMEQITARFEPTELQIAQKPYITSMQDIPLYDIQHNYTPAFTLPPQEITIPRKPQQFLQFLTDLAARFDSIFQKRYDGTDIISFEIEQLVASLPMPDNVYWANIPLDSIVPILDKLYLLMLFYGKINCGHLAISIEQQNVFLHIFAIMYSLACKKDIELSNFGLNIDYFLENFGVPGWFVCFNQEAFNKKMALITFFQSKPNKRFVFCPLSIHGYGELVLKYAEYLKKTIKKNPRFFTRLELARNTLREDDASRSLGDNFDNVATIMAIDDEVLQDSGLEHIRFLRQAEALSRMFCGLYSIEYGHCTTATPLEAIWNNGLQYTLGFSFLKVDEAGVPQKEFELCKRYVFNNNLRKESTLHLHRQGGRTEFNKWNESRYEDYEDLELFTVDDEKKFLREGKERVAQHLQLPRDLGSASVHPRMRPNEVLAYFRRNFSSLTPFYQTIFDSLLFKPYTIKGIWQVPIYEEAQKKSFLDQCTNFINEGLEYCLERHAGKVDVHKALFFIRFCDRIRVLNPAAKLPSMDEVLEELLKLPYLNEFEKRAIHLQRIFHYSILPASEKLSDDILKKVIVSWFCFNKGSSDPDWDDPYIIWYVNQFIISLSPILQEKMNGPAVPSSKGKEAESFRDTILSLIEKAIVNEESANGPWTGVFPLFERGAWRINILKAQIHYNYEILSPPFGNIDPTEVHYKKLFNGELFQLTPTVGGFFSFDHPQFGKMRLHKLSQRHDLEIHRQINGKWYKYICCNCDTESSCFTALQSVVPPALLGKEYAMFVDLEEAHQGNRIVYIEPLQKDKGPSYRLEIWRCYNSARLYELDENGQKKYRILPCQLPNFENQGFQLLDLDAEYSRDTAIVPSQVKIIKFPRYRSLATGQTLSFCGPNMQWEENPSFVLQNKKKTGLLGKMANYYLLLRDDKTGREKILVPLQRVLPNKNKLHDALSVELDVEDVYKTKQEKTENIPEFLREQIGIYNFIEFDVIEGKVVPISIEGTLFNAYLELLKRNYVEAKKLLDSIAHYEDLSKTSQIILNWILVEGEDRVDFSPPAAAVRLSAAYLLYKYDGDAVVASTITQDLRIYRKSYSSVRAELRLNQVEQEFWGRALSRVNIDNLPSGAHNVKLTIPQSRLTRYETSRKGSVGGSLALQQGRDESFNAFEEYQEFFDKELVDGESPLQEWNFPKADDNAYAASLDLEYDKFKEDYKAGHDKNSDKVRYKLRNGRLLELQSNLQQRYSKQKKAVDDEKNALVDFANTPCSNSAIALRDKVLQEGHYLAPLDINDLLNLFLIGDFNEYAKALPYFTENQIKDLDIRIQHFLLSVLKLQKLDRAWALSNDEKEQDSLALELMAPLAHNIEDRDLLVFEYRANIILRLEQVTAIAKMLSQEEGHFRNLTLQMMMGGGKTSILGLIWLYKAAHVPGRLAVFIPPSAQFETLKLNLGRTQKSNFKQDVLSVKMTKEEMTLANLEKLERQIDDTIKSHGVLLITKETLQTLELELFYVLDHYSESVARLTQESNQKRACLTRILNTIRGKGDFLIDESDLLLSPNLEVNLPISAPSNLRYEFVMLIETIYKLHADTDLKYRGQSIGDIIGLTRNEQNTLDTSFYQRELQPVIARALLETFLGFKGKIPVKYREEFVRYVCGQMTPQNQTEQDKEFRAYLKAQAGSNDEEKKQLADQIALAKFFFVKILPLTLTRSTGRSYGRSPEHPSGKVVPYLGVDTPSPTTEFGSPWIAAAYHFQTVLSKGLSLDQVRRMVERFAKMAEQEAIKKGCRVDQTVAARRFFEATRGRHIAKTAGDERAIRQLWQEFNQHMEDRLTIERETVADVVEYYKSYLGSTAQDFVLQCSTVRTFSGTPWNHHCYGAGLDKDENLALEKGVEGSIVDKMLRKAADRQLLHEVDAVSVQNVLGTVMQAPRKMVQGLIDAGGIFKNFDNAQVARDIAEYFKDNPHIEYVLFFGRKDPAEATPDNLMAFKRGFSKPIYIGSTSKEELNKRGITRENAFVYFDEKHSEATDLPFGKEGRGVVTMSARMDLRTQLQAIMRLREFFKEQDVEYVIPKAERGLFFRQGVTIGDCVATFLKNQGEKKAEQAYQSARQRIRAFLRHRATASTLENPDKQVTLYKESYHKVFKSELSDSPYKDYGQLEEEITAQEALQNFAEIELNKFTQLSNDEKRVLREEVNAIINAEVLKGRLPKKVTASDLAVDFQVAIERETETELETELQQELERYNTFPESVGFEEILWREYYEKESLSRMVEVRLLKGAYPYPVMIQLNNLLKNGPTDGDFRYDKPYEIIFDDNIALTNNLALTYAHFVPIFNTAQKRAEQILVIKEPKGLRYVLLSVYDASFLKELLEKHQCKDMWLFLADGTQISNNPEPSFSAEEKEQLNRMFVQVNIFNGQVAYLDAHEEDFKRFLATKDDDTQDVLLRFLKLKVEKDSVQRSILYRSVIKNFSSWTRQMEIRDLPDIDAAQIPKVPPRLYKYLTRQDQIQAVPLDKVKFLVPPQIKSLTDEQIKKLERESESASTPHDEKWLEEGSTIFNAVRTEQLYLLSADQLHQLGKNRVNDVPDGRVKDLADYQLKWLNNDKLNKVPSERYGDLLPVQFRYLEQARIADIPPQCVKHLTIYQIPWLTTPEQFDEVAPDRVQYLGAKLRQRKRVNDIPNELLCCLSKEQVQRLSDIAKVNALPARVENMPEWLSRETEKTDNMLSWLTKDQLKMLQKERLRDLPTAFYQELDGAHKQMLFETFGTITDVNEIQALKNIQIQYLSPEALKLLSKEQKTYVNNLSDREALVQSDNLLRLKYSKGLGLKIHKVALRILQCFLFFFSFIESVKRKRATIEEKRRVKNAIIERLKNIPRNAFKA